MAELKTNLDVALTPLGYATEEITLINHRGVEVDIQNLVTEIQFTESIYSTPIQCLVKVKDVMNVLQDYEFCGQERLRVSINRQVFDDSGDIESLKLDFIITDYPLYGRGSEQYAQAYEITAVTPFVYLGQTKNVCKATKVSTVNEIKKIIASLDSTQQVMIEGTPKSKLNAVIPNQSAMSAIKMLRDISFDDSQTPYVAHMRIDGVFHIMPFSIMMDANANPVVKTLNKDYLWTEKVDEKSAYDEKAHRVFELNSKLKLGKMQQHIKGAFSSYQNAFDLSTKIRVGSDYSYNGSLIDTEWDAGWGQPIVNDQQNDVKFSTVWNSMNQSGAVDDNYQKAFIKSRQNRIAQNALFDSYEHDLIVAGDFNLNPGKRIELRIPIAADISERDDNEIYDASLSGEYIIVSAIHTFGKEYTTALQVKRNSR
mgnify:CR=1 FL=1